MLIERKGSDKIQITFSRRITASKLQQLIDYVNYFDMTSASKAKQKDVDMLADEVNASWWQANRKRFIR